MDPRPCGQGDSYCLLTQVNTLRLQWIPALAGRVTYYLFNAAQVDGLLQWIPALAGSVTFRQCCRRCSCQLASMDPALAGRVTGSQP